MSVFKPGIYQHYKGPRYVAYEVARHSETEEELVVYRPMYGEAALWVRPLSMFLGAVEVDGQMQSRFRWLAESDEVLTADDA